MRVQLTIPEPRKDEIEILKQVTDSRDYAALLDASLTAFQWMVWEVAQGRSIVSVKDGDPRERVLVMRELESAGDRLPEIIARAQPAAPVEEPAAPVEG